MAQKRKVEVTAVDKTDRVFNSIFCNAANDLSQLYSQSLNQQKLTFGAGQRHALEKLNEWITMKLQEGKMITTADISAYLQDELNHSVPSSQLQQPWGSGSHQSSAFQSRQMEVNLSSAPLTQSQYTDGDAFGSHDLEMEINPEDSIH